jgi:hypothetical protein
MLLPDILVVGEGCRSWYIREGGRERAIKKVERHRSSNFKGSRIFTSHLQLSEKSEEGRP